MNWHTCNSFSSSSSTDSCEVSHSFALQTTRKQSASPQVSQNSWLLAPPPKMVPNTQLSITYNNFTTYVVASSIMSFVSSSTMRIHNNDLSSCTTYYHKDHTTTIYHHWGYLLSNNMIYIIANAVTEEGVVAYLKLLIWSRNKQQKDTYTVYYGHIVWMWKEVEHTSEVTRVLALPRYLQHSSLETERWELEASYATSLLLLSGQCSASLAPTETCRHTSVKLTLNDRLKIYGPS